MKLFGLIGKPVLFSKSPQMHAAGYRAQSVSAKYLRIAAQDAKQSLRFARELGVIGLNVTAPFKIEMARAGLELDSDAKLAGSVNTVLLQGEKARGFNTDTYGVSQTIKCAGLDVRGLPAMILGAGGAARAVACALKKLGAEIIIANRTEAKAQELADEFGGQAIGLNGTEIDRRIAKCALVVSTLSQDLELQAYDHLQSGVVVLDARLGASKFVERAKAAGANVIDGREWLLHQGVKAYELFLGQDAPIEAMRKAVYDSASCDDCVPKCIALIGLMGVGKSSTALVLSKLLDRELCEIDEQIESEAGMSVAEIFEQRGEAVFRDLEERALSDALNGRRCILSCGGGATMRDSNFNLLLKKSLGIWLSASPQAIIDRIDNLPERPLLATEAPVKRLVELFLERKNRYAEISELVIDTERISATDVANRIVYELNAAWPN
jgi:shikimate dehydrogenase